MKFPYIHPRDKKWWSDIPDPTDDPDEGTFLRLVDARVIFNTKATETWMQIYGSSGGHRRTFSKLINLQPKRGDKI